MFNFISSRKNAGKVLSSFVVLACAAFVLCVASCKEPDDTSAENTVIGTWLCESSSQTEKYIVTAAKFEDWGKASTATVFSESYAGSDLDIEKADETSGIIYMKYTRSMNSDWSYSESAPDVGKWYAVAYKNLTSTSVAFSGAYSATGVTSTETLAAAKTEFTAANGYFPDTGYSECTKQ